MIRRFRVKVEGKSYEVEVEEVSFGGNVSSANPPQVASSTISSATTMPAGQTLQPGQVISPIPGKVLKIIVEVGQRVSRGDTLMVIESMKIENPILAQGDGKIKEIRVSTGAQVRTGDLLVVMD